MGLMGAFFEQLTIGEYFGYSAPSGEYEIFQKTDLNEMDHTTFNAVTVRKKPDGQVLENAYQSHRFFKPAEYVTVTAD